MIVTIRKFEREDIPKKVEWINNPKNNQFLHYDIPINIEKTQKWFENNLNRIDRYDAVIEVDGVSCGVVGLLNIDKKNNKAEFYITMGEVTLKGKGVATLASKLILEYGFKELGLNRIYLFTEAENILAQKLFVRIGFVKEGCLKDDIISHGVYVDRIYKSSDVPNNINDYDINFAFDNYKNDSFKLFKINAFLNYQDLENINSEVIKINGLNELLKMFKEELFYTGIEVENKRNLLEILLNDLKIKNYLDDSECEQVLEREKLTSTEIAMDVAFPHVIVKSDSFLSFVILKRPIFWRNNYIKIVVLMGISNGDTDAKNAIQYLFSRLANENVVSEIERSNKYDDVLKIIREKDVC